MKGLVACEESQVVTKAFRAKGHEVYSNDIIECSGGHPEWHLQMDAREALYKEKWDFVIAHPPCTRLSNSGVLRLYLNGKKENGIDPLKWKEMEEGAEFFKMFVDYPCKLKGIENPVMHGHAKKLIGLTQSQIIQPYQFGEDASKATCLWLFGFPNLLPTTYYLLPTTYYLLPATHSRWKEKMGKPDRRWPKQITTIRT